MAVTVNGRTEAAADPAEQATGHLSGLLAAVAPPEEVAARFRAEGWWRDETFLYDLYRTAATDPGRPAIVSQRIHRPADRRTVTVSYAQLALYVDRFAAALDRLGIGAGDPVAFQLPSWWEAAALTLACLRVGALAVPVLPTVRAHGLERILEGSRARICVVPDVWEGFPHAQALADLAPALPWLRHRVVIGDAAATGALDFAGYFQRTPHERGPRARRLGLRSDRADRISLMITVMSLGDAYAAALHTPNTLYANISTQRDPAGPGRRPGEVFYSALPLTSLASLLYSVCWPLAVGGTGVYQDVWDPGSCLDLMAAAGVNQAYAAPVYWSEVLTAQQHRPRELGALRLLLSGGRTSTPAQLLADLPGALGAPVRTVWGAPELGMGTVTRGDTPAERNAESDGRPLPGLEVSVVPAEGVGDARTSQLRVRGPSVCLATWQRGGGPAPLITWDRDEGWLDTGDLAKADGLGGVQVMRRAGERLGGIFLVPVAELEERLLTHPRVREAAVVGYVDPEYGEMPCAVVVPTTEAEPPGLVELRDHLAGRGVAAAFLPTRLELVGSLPRDDRGELRKEGLRSWLARIRPGVPRPVPVPAPDA
ncbi:AMP-binding protein [Streptomyces sp. So13.3]|uniref:AMP-binding protein n=1 Tax=Streptomyces sp. So13.3 TaxID=2136173 RepID=UPI00110757DC|nr:AMP-binding protein [Streptomyces sp. So13.3]QNA75292.1 AMP-binding protein [Streptomyces sp. So13.3]